MRSSGEMATVSRWCPSILRIACRGKVREARNNTPRGCRVAISKVQMMLYLTQEEFKSPPTLVFLGERLSPEHIFHRCPNSETSRSALATRVKTSKIPPASYSILNNSRAQAENSAAPCHGTSQSSKDFRPCGRTGKFRCDA